VIADYPGDRLRPQPRIGYDMVVEVILIDEINKFLRQGIHEKMTFEDTVEYLLSIARKL